MIIAFLALLKLIFCLVFYIVTLIMGGSVTDHKNDDTLNNSKLEQQYYSNGQFYPVIKNWEGWGPGRLLGDSKI